MDHSLQLTTVSYHMLPPRRRLKLLVLQLHSLTSLPSNHLPQQTPRPLDTMEYQPPAERGYNQPPSQGFVYAGNRRALTNLQWRRDGEDGETTPELTASYTNLQTFSHGYQLPREALAQGVTDEVLETIEGQ